MQASRCHTRAARDHARSPSATPGSASCCGIINAVGTEVLGWDDPVAFLSQRSAEVTILGIEITVPVALLTVMAFEAWRYFPFGFLFLTARIQALPRDLEKAAQMDGATVSQRAASRSRRRC